MDPCCTDRRTLPIVFVIMISSTTIIVALLFVSSGQYMGYNSMNPSPVMDLFNSSSSVNKTSSSFNTVFIYSGRWEFLQIQLPYIYRDLKNNGGVIDQVQFMMVQYESNTLDKLIKFTNIANGILMEDVFSIHYMGYIPYSPPPSAVSGWHQALYEVNEELIKNPQKTYFKLDDDVVYIHPKAFANMIDMKKSDCAIHYFNIAGCNWRCSWLHQKYGVFDGLNPKKLKFGFGSHTKCGYGSVECANLTLETFLHLYHKSKLEKFFFDVEYLTDRERFSINGYLIDNNTNPFNLKKTLLQKEFHEQTEERILHKYFQHTPYPPCIVGKALIVHFAYSGLVKELLSMGFLEKFHDLVKESKDSFHMPVELWQVLDSD